MKMTHNAKLSLMTWNIYLGADLSPIFEATLDKLPQAVTDVYRQFLATDFSSRVKSIARQIYQKSPDIISLQEVGLWELISDYSPSVKYDFKEILLNALECFGIGYIVAAENENFKAALPDMSGNLISLIDRDIILIRDSDKIEVIQKQVGNYKTNLEIKIGNQPFVLKRGWSAIDARIQGKDFRIVNTHLEGDSLEVQLAQSIELLKEQGQTKLPLIFMGDFNSSTNGIDAETYEKLIADGFNDTWNIAGKDDGFTGFQDPDLLNSESLLIDRTDWILYRNKSHWKVTKVELVGETQANRTMTALWPSDHAGVTATLRLKSSSCLDEEE